MSTDPVVVALRAALAAGDNVQVRVALGRRLLDLGQADEALQEIERAIAMDPTNREALTEAVRAAGAAGDAARAQAYELALGTASGVPTGPSRPAPRRRCRGLWRAGPRPERCAPPSPARLRACAW